MQTVRDTYIWTPFCESVRGAAHIRKNRPNQDSFWICEGGKTGNGMPMPAVVAVSDGHGGDKYIRSESGSELAVGAMRGIASAMARSESYFSPGMGICDVDETAEHVKARLLAQWQNAVDFDLKMYPLTDGEKSFLETHCSKADYISVMENNRVVYGCTFLCAIACNNAVLILQYGDGDILGLYPDGETYDLTAGDPRNCANETLSLCRLTNPAEIRHKSLVTGQLPVLMTISTDGVKNSFDDLHGGKGNCFYKIPTDIMKLLVQNDNDISAVRSVLAGELKRITADGSGDDVTLGVLYMRFPTL